MNELKCWLVGVDWACENHRVRIADGRAKRLGERDFAQRPAEMARVAQEYNRGSGMCNSRRDRNAA
jgi:hypothetical protein